MVLLTVAVSPVLGGIVEQIKLAQANQDPHAEVELLRRSLDQNPNDPATRERLIRLWLELADLTMAQNALAEWKDAPPNLATLVVARVRAERDGQWDDAISGLQTFVKTAPKDAEVLGLLSRYLGQQKRWAEQIAVLDQLLEWRAVAVDYLTRAEAKKQLGDYAGAVRDAKRASAIAPDSSIVRSTVPKFERLESVLPLIASTTQTLTKQPNDAPALLTRSAAFWFGNVPEKALADAERASPLLPDSAMAVILKARSLSALNPERDYELANEFAVNLGGPIETPAVAARLIQADVQVAAGAKNATALATRANLLNHDQQFRLALVSAEQALQFEPVNGPALLEAIYAASKSGQTEDAAAYFRRLDQAKAVNESLALALAYLVESNFAAANYRQTLEFANRALQIKETEPMLRFKAQALRRLGNDEEADGVMALAEKLKTKAKK